MRKRLPIPLIPLLLSVGAGCANGRIEADYTLQLVPRTPVNQAPFDDGPSISLLVDQRGELTVLPLGTAAGETVSAEALGPLSSATVGLVLEVPANTSETIDPLAVLAYGQAGPFTLSKGDGEVITDVLVAEVGAVGDLDLLGSAVFGASLAVTESGDAWIFGGSSALSATSMPADGHLLHLEDLDGGDWRFADVGAMPTVGTSAGAIGSTASVVSTDDGPGILVAGGRLDGADWSANLGAAFLLDPLTGAVSWSSEFLRDPRSGHRAVVMDNGRVLLVGGFTGLTDGGPAEFASYEVFDPTWLNFNLGTDELAVPALGFGIADLGADGVLVCGGSVPSDTTPRTSFAPTAACNLISVLGVAQRVADLPAAVQMLEMAPLGDGRVLACGGTTATLDGTTGTAGAASASAWLYDVASDAWTTTSSMGNARAQHVIVTTNDGRATIMGGTELASHYVDEVGAAVTCTEVFDASTESFTATGCGGTGSGAGSAVSSAPGQPAVVLSGYDDEGGGGSSYGVVGRGPAL